MNQSGVIDSRLLQCDHSACTVSKSSPGWHSTLSALRSEICTHATHTQSCTHKHLCVTAALFKHLIIYRKVIQRSTIEHIAYFHLHPPLPQPSRVASRFPTSNHPPYCGSFPIWTASSTLQDLDFVDRPRHIKTAKAAKPFRLIDTPTTIVEHEQVLITRTRNYSLWITRLI